MDKCDIHAISCELSNYLYFGDTKATKQLVELFDKISKKPLKTPDDYIDMYDLHFYTYRTWEELVQSEIEQGEFGLTEEECKEQLNNGIWQLPCGWYVQYV